MINYSLYWFTYKFPEIINLAFRLGEITVSPISINYLVDLLIRNKGDPVIKQSNNNDNKKAFTWKIHHICTWGLYSYTLYIVITNIAICFLEPGQVKRENEHWQNEFRDSQHVIKIEIKKIMKRKPNKVLRK